MGRIQYWVDTPDVQMGNIISKQCLKTENSSHWLSDRDWHRNGKVVRVTAPVFTGDVEACPNVSSENHGCHPDDLRFSGRFQRRWLALVCLLGLKVELLFIQYFQWKTTVPEETEPQIKVNHLPRAFFLLSCFSFLKCIFNSRQPHIYTVFQSPAWVSQAWQRPG